MVIIAYQQAKNYATDKTEDFEAYIDAWIYS